MDRCMSCAGSKQGVPKGHLAVYVGQQRRRFVIPTGYLSKPLFMELLQSVEEEFGFQHKGGLTIPCDVERFMHVIRSLERMPSR